MATKVLIGIQARSTSERLPGKAFEMIAGKTMTQRVVQSCRTAARMLCEQGRCEATVSVLVPAGDRIATEMRGWLDIYEGPELDVLARYFGVVEARGSDYVVRVTGDCPMLPSWAVSRTVALALANGYDYISNVDERFRTAIDGSDVEVVSRRLLVDTQDRATEAADREHVTTLIRRDPPGWAKLGFVMNHFDLSGIKLSVDTPEDLERVRRATESGVEKEYRAQLHFGKSRVHFL